MLVLLRYRTDQSTEGVASPPSFPYNPIEELTEMPETLGDLVEIIFGQHDLQPPLHICYTLGGVPMIMIYENGRWKHEERPYIPLQEKEDES